MDLSFRLRVWGDFALFTRPELSVERYSYPMMTPSAARGVLEAIFWHPGMAYIIDQIDVLKPIQMIRIKRNEVSCKMGGQTDLKGAKEGREVALYAQEKLQQRTSVLLKDVEYVIHSHVVLEEKVNKRDSAKKFFEIFTRRAKKGQYCYCPCMGVRECPADFELLTEADDVKPVDIMKDLGWMLHSMDYHVDVPRRQRPLPTPRFFEARLVHGSLNVKDCEVHG